jgi:hypothetical protein
MANVLLSVRFGGVLRGLAGLLAGRLTRDYVAQEAAALRRRVES